MDARLDDIELPTLGHFLEDGFAHPRVQRVAGSGRVHGRARTVDLVEPDAHAVNRGLLAARAGDVLVIRVRSGVHAPIGAVTAAAAATRGIAAIVVDGPVTDAAALADAPFPVYATGWTARTTKRLPSSAATVGEPTEVGGVVVADGDLVLADEHGVLFAAGGSIPEAVVVAAAASDAAEPELLRRIAAGDPLDTLLAH